MFGFLRLGRAERSRTGPMAEDSSSQPYSSMPQSTQQHTATHRELVRVVLRDTLRLNGIPTDWLGCEVLTRSRSASEGALQIHLLIHHWHEGLLRYAPLIQQQLLQGLQRFDPATDHSRHSVVWKFSPACRSPYTDMPDPAYWTGRGSRPDKFELPPSEYDNLDSGFAPTQPSTWR